MCLSEVDWEETREVSPHAASDEYCQTRIVICTLCTGHLCYPGLVWTLQVTTAPATGLLSSQQWHIFQISKWSYWIICNLNWEKPTARGGLLEFITKMSVTHISWTWHPARVTQGCCENAAILIIADSAQVRGHEPRPSRSPPPGLDHSATEIANSVDFRGLIMIKKFKSVIEWSGFDASELIKSLESISDSE